MAALSLKPVNSVAPNISMRSFSDDITGAMILSILIDELHRRQLRYGLATLCVGGGMGIATIVERV